VLGARGVVANDSDVLSLLMELTGQWNSSDIQGAETFIVASVYLEFIVVIGCVDLSVIDQI
jgi:hypothetical protein